MSQNLWEVEIKGHPVPLCTGWDRPLSALYCRVGPLEDSDAVPDEAFELAEQLACMGFDSAESLHEALSSFGVTVPSSVLEAVRSDCVSEAGNVVRVFDKSGHLKTFETF